MASAEPTAKAGWEVKTLGEVCIVDWGNTELTKKSYIEEGEFLAVSAAGCDGRINHAEHKKFTPVLSAIGAQCGRMFFPEEDFTAIKNTITLTPIQTETYHKFLFHLLTAVELPKRGAAQPFISKGDIQSFPIPVPPLPEQERIVGILDEAFEGIAAATAQAEKNLHNARELFQSVLQSTFSQKGDNWVETVLGEACELIKRGIAPKYIDEGGLCVINQKCVRDHTVDFRLSRRHNLSIKKVPEERIVRPGDVLVNSTGVGTLGRVAQIREETQEAATVDTHVTIVRPIKGKFYLDFFGYMMVIIEKEIAASGEGSSGQTELSRKALNENFIVRYPKSHTTQQAIVEKLDALSEETKRLEAIYERKQAALTELKQSLLQKAFAGEL